MIGPKGKVINTIQSETGADISVDDDGAQGIVTIGAVEAGAWRRPRPPSWPSSIRPRPSSNAVYKGRVVNITKFGAFVNILPGRDGLVHISKLGGGKRINAVEDVLSLGQELEVRVDEIDDKGKVSLTPGRRRARPPAAVSPAAGDGAVAPADGNGERCRQRLVRGQRSTTSCADEVGDLGPAERAHRR